MPKLPSIKEELKAYLLGEEGRISKKALLTVGTILTMTSLGSLLAEAQATHTKNSLQVTYKDGLAAAIHTNHNSAS